jgi:hypothetical protein
MRQNINLIAILLAMLIPFSLASTTFTIGDLQYNTTATDEVEVSAANTNLTRAIVSSTVKYGSSTYKVTSVASYGFRDCASLTNVDISSIYLKKVGKYAFLYCTSLTTVIIDYATTIEDSAFSGCEALSSVTLPDDLTTLGSSESGRTFYGCKSLRSIALPNSLKKLYDCTFENCTSLKTINIPANVTEIGTRNDNWKSGVVFEGCSNLQSITVDADNSTFKSIDGVLFCGSRLVCYPNGRPDSEYVQPEGTNIANESAFDYPLNLKSLTVRDATEGYFPALKKLTLAEDYYPSYIIKDGGEYWIYNDFIDYYTNNTKYFPVLQTLEIAEGNKYYRTENNCIYQIYRPDHTTILTPQLQWIEPSQRNSLTEYCGNFSPNVFENCTNLKTVLLQPTKYQDQNGNITTEWTFSGINAPNSTIEKLQIPATITEFDEVSFDKKITSLYLLSLTPPHLYEMDYSIILNVGTLYVPKASVNLYQADNSWNRISNIQGLNLISVNNNLKNGSILINGFDIDQLGSLDGENITISLQTDETDYRVKLNGEDITQKIENNSYTVASNSSDLTFDISSMPVLTMEYNSDYGKTFINGTECSYFTLDENPVEVLLLPNDDCRLTNVTLNDVDITDQIINRQYTIPASNEQQVMNITFEPEQDAILSIVTPSNVKCNLNNKVGDTVQLQFDVDSEWEISLLEFNGVDVTEDVKSDGSYTTPELDSENTLNVVLCERTTSIDETSMSQQLKVTTSQRNVTITNKQSSTTVEVYNTAGDLIKYTTEAMFTLDSDGIYILKIGNQRFKIALKG